MSNQTMLVVVGPTSDLQLKLHRQPPLHTLSHKSRGSLRTMFQGNRGSCRNVDSIVTRHHKSAKEI